jgi:hypothetical protein
MAERPNYIPKPASGMLGSVTLSKAPQLLGLQAQQQGHRSELARVGAMGNLSRQEMQSQAGFGQRGVGLDRQSLGLQQQQLGREQGFGDRERDLIFQLLGLEEEGIGLGETGAKQQHQRAQRGTVSDATARGAYGSPGYKAALAEHDEDLGGRMGEFGLQRQGVGVKRGQEQVRHERGQQERDTARRQMDVEAQRLGMRSEELQAGLDQGLRKLGLDTYFDSQSLYAAIKSGDAQMAGVAQQILEQAWNLR